MFRFIDSGPILSSLDGNTEFVAFDLETTGLYPDVDRITEIGAVRFGLVESLARYETLIDPERPIPPDASRVSGITDELVGGKPRIEEKLGEFLEFAGRSLLVAHNARFDGGFLRAVLLRAGLPLIENPIFDTRLMAKALWPGLRSYRLGDVLESLCLSRDNLHRALGDALGCRDVFLASLRKLGEGKALTRRDGKRIAIVLTEDDVDETV